MGCFPAGRQVMKDRMKGEWRGRVSTHTAANRALVCPANDRRRGMVWGKTVGRPPHQLLSVSPTQHMPVCAFAAKSD